MVPEGPVTAHAFVDYSAYILKRPSTPTAGIKAGCMMAVGVLGDQNPFEDFGKSLGLQQGSRDAPVHRSDNTGQQPVDRGRDAEAVRRVRVLASRRSRSPNRIY